MSVSQGESWGQQVWTANRRIKGKLDKKGKTEAILTEVELM